MQMEATASHGEGWNVPPIPAEVFNVNAGDLEWVNRQCTMQPLATFQQPIHLTGDIARVKNVTFILASGWTPSPFPSFYERAKAKGWKTTTMACGHECDAGHAGRSRSGIAGGRSTGRCSQLISRIWSNCVSRRFSKRNFRP